MKSTDTMLSKLSNFINERRAGYSNVTLLRYFKTIRYQCKWQGRDVDTLLEYINELEFRGIRYRL